MKSILVPVDGSDASVRALAFARDLSRAFGAKIVALYVFDSWNEIFAGFAVANGKEMDEMVERISKLRLAETIDRARVEGVTVEQHRRIGHPAAEIMSFAEEIMPDMIVMGSRGRSTLEELVVGSVSLKILHRARIPVTVVK
jgi:nucleotide-binding universal stress UspA family protein